jgi:hypothetical protein
MSREVATFWRWGGCHCGAVRFEVALANPALAQACNCSICAMTGFVHLIVPESRFRLASGADVLTSYTFNTHTARHLFCRICGVKSFYRPRYDHEGLTIDVSPFDGAHWEEHAGALAELSRESS